MLIETKTLFTIISTAMHEMKKHPEDFKKTYPVAKKLLTEIFMEWNDADEVFIDKKPF